jgi:hypothetical protein
MLSLPSTTVNKVGDNLFLEFPESAVVVWGAAAQAVISSIPGE